MFELSITTVAVACILLYVFRRPLKQFNNDAPVLVSNVLNTAVKSSVQLDHIVSTNCAENEVDLRARMKAVTERVKDEQLPTVDEGYNFIMGIK